MSDILFFASLIAGWIVLNVWILPLFGIQTCMSGACRVPRARNGQPLDSAGEAVHKPKATS